MIWFNKALTLADVEHIMPNTMADFLGMEWVAIGPDYLGLRMPVTDKTKQPYGLLHGGASCALAETIGSIGSALVVDQAVNMCVGLEINANHLRAATSGYVTATARPVHLGRSTHVWDIRLEDDQQKLVCISRLTVAILPKK